MSSQSNPVPDTFGTIEGSSRISCCTHPDLDASKDPSVSRGHRGAVLVIGTICEYLKHRMLFAVVLLDLIQQRDEPLVVLHGFVDDLQIKRLVGSEIDHDIGFDPATSNPLLFPYPFAPVGGLDPGTANGGGGVILGEALMCYGGREIQVLNPVKRVV